MNGQPFQLSAPAAESNSSVFAGFISATPITSITFSGGEFGPAVDNLQFGSAAVPELSSLLGFGSFALLGGMGLLRRRRA